MQKEKFQEYLHSPESRKNAEQPELEALISEYPWFSSAMIILLHGSKMRNDPGFNLLLKKYSIFISDRKVLYKIFQPLSGTPGTKKSSLADEVKSPELQSRINGIFSSLENDMPENSIQTENPNSILDDDSLLDFSYSSKKVQNSLENEGLKGSALEIPKIKTEDIDILNSSKEEEGNNFDHWISKVDEWPEKEEPPLKKHEIIESFIHSDPGVIRADKETQLQGDISKGSAEEHEGFITDTLAKIYVKQGLYNKAIYAYEKLCLKYPEKSIYFASQIEEINRLITKK